MLELFFAVFLPAVGSALLFNIGASSGGTDLIAMILKNEAQGAFRVHADYQLQ